MSHLFLGCIADDFTGASDLANNLVRAGMRVVQTIGVPAAPLSADVDAVVVALKSRTIAPQDAIAQSLAALAWLQAQGAEQIYFKYCSTFDSTAQGNIGPVTEALMDALGTNFTIATPAFPDNNRTVFKGYLFAGDTLLNESGMQNHPLTPMLDAKRKPSAWSGWWTTPWWHAVLMPYWHASRSSKPLARVWRLWTPSATLI
jgi:3-dehydrotetronate 4-kinase